MGMIGLVALVMDPTLSPNLALPHVINVAMPVGLKGLAIAGLLAVLMSSADSFLNAATISVIQDVVKPLKQIKYVHQQQLLCSRMTTVCIGILGGIFALSTQSALDILLVAYNFWTPFILVPLVSGIMGFRASSTAFWLGCIGGITATSLWLLFMGDTDFNGSIAGITVNLIIYITVRHIERSRRRLAVA
jgi:SSS family solute:Na+ symporter